MSIMRFSSLFTSFLAVFMLSSFEKPGSNSYGLTPSDASWITWEQRAFDDSLKKLQKREFFYKKILETQIAKQIARYKTGLQTNHINNLSQLIVHESKKYSFDPLLLTAVIITESSFNNRARSNKGALGLMQIIPATGKELANEVSVQWRGIPSLYDPEINIILGAYYLSKLFLRFGDLGLALEAYNHGPSRLKGYLKKGHLPKHYSQKVFKNYSSLMSNFYWQNWHEHHPPSI
jgi:soluble lytic murein transglycosylase-like protein